MGVSKALLLNICLFLFKQVSSRNLASKSFVQESTNPSSNPIPYCEHDDWLSCDQVNVDLEALRSNKPVILPDGEMVRPIETSPGSEPGSITVFYQSDDLLDSMTATFFTAGSNNVNAIIHEDDRVFNLAPCDQTGEDCHVLAEENPDLFNVEEISPNATMRDLELMTQMALNELPDVEEDRQEQGRFQRDADGTYVATIKIYYTKEFAQAESNVGAYISNMITQANAGLRNSGTKLRLRVLATQQLNNITENRDPVQILTQFVRIKGTPTNLRGTADFAHLLVRQTTNTNCGIAYIGSTRLPFGVSKRDCAISNFTFGHELGHNLGCNHDRANSRSSDPFAFGYLIPNTGRRTMLAYWNPNHRTRINYYSTPDVRFSNVPMGNAQNNCARRIRENARAFASIGSDTN